MYIVAVSVTEWAAVMSTENGTADSVSVFNVCAYEEEDLFVRNGQIENPDFLLRDASLSSVTLLLALFFMYVFDYSSGTLSVTLYPVMNADDVTTSSTSGMNVGRQALNSSA